MASAAVSESSPIASSTPSDAELLDILYELLADGTGEEHGVSSETIESFLHEHARNPRKPGAMASFFQEHGLSMRAEDYGRDPALSVVPSGLHMAPLGPAADWPSDAARTSSPPDSARASQPLVSEPTPSAAAYVRSAPSAARRAWLVPVMVGLVLLAGVAGTLATVTALQEQQLERELTLSNLQLRSTQGAVDELRSQAQRLDRELQAREEAERALKAQVAELTRAEEERREAAAEREARRARRAPAKARRRPASTAPAATPTPEVVP